MSEMNKRALIRSDPGIDERRSALPADGDGDSNGLARNRGPFECAIVSARAAVAALVPVAILLHVGTVATEDEPREEGKPFGSAGHAGRGRVGSEPRGTAQESRFAIEPRGRVGFYRIETELGPLSQVARGHAAREGVRAICHPRTTVAVRWPK